MARFLPKKSLSMEDFSEVPAELQPAFEKLCKTLNPFLTETPAALGALSFGDNFTACALEAKVTAPDWIAPTLQNSWVNFDSSSHQTAGYWMDDAGFVRLRGIVKDGTPPSTMYTLPEGYRPNLREHFTAVSNLLFGYGYIDPTGIVVAHAGDPAWFTGGNVAFKASGGPVSFSGNGWPLQLKPTFKGPVRYCWLGLCEDLSSGKISTHGVSAVSWENTTNGLVKVRRVSGLNPGTSYRLRFLLVGG